MWRVMVTASLCYRCIMAVHEPSQILIFLPLKSIQSKVTWTTSKAFRNFMRVFSENDYQIVEHYFLLLSFLHLTSHRWVVGMVVNYCVLWPDAVQKQNEKYASVGTSVGGHPLLQQTARRQCLIFWSAFRCKFVQLPSVALCMFFRVKDVYYFDYHSIEILIRP